MGFNMKYFMLSAFTIAALVVTSGCASNPMKERLERNLVYQCSLQMLEKNVDASSAERICASAHKSEMDEKQFAAAMRSGRVVPPARQPASVQQAAPQPTLAQPTQTDMTPTD